MKYKRVTEYQKNTRATIIEPMTLQGIIDFLAELEDKIECGELISTVQDEQSKQEIEFFAEHNAAVRKQAVRAFAEKLRDKEFSVKIGSAWFAVVKSRDIDELVKEECGE